MGPISQLDALFYPSSLAIVGATADPAKLGFALVRGFKEIGFQGTLYLVNPHASQPVLGWPVYRSIKEIPGALDLAIIITPPPTIPYVLKECTEKGVRGVVVFSTPPEPLQPAEIEAIEMARSRGVRIIGPNSMGIYCPKSGLTLFPGLPRQPGRVSFISHSGSFAWSFSVAAAHRGVGCSKVVVSGNEWDLTWTDFLEYFGGDPDTDIIAGYMEGTKEGERFLRVAKEVSAKKPVFCVKGGDSATGGDFTMSHTGSVAGSRTTWEAVFRQADIVRTADIHETLDHIMVFQAFKEMPLGRRVGLVSGTGGLLVTTSDLCEAHGLLIPRLSSSSRELLSSILPPHGSSSANPVDVSIAAASDLALYSEPIKVLDQSEEVDIVITVHTGDWRGDEVAKRIATENTPRPKPLVVIMVGVSDTTSRALKILAEAGIPAFREQRNPIKAIAELIRWRERRDTVLRPLQGAAALDTGGGPQ